MAAAVFVGLYTVQHLFQLVSRFGQVDHQRESLLHLISEKLTENLPHIMALSVHIVIFFSAISLHRIQVIFIFSH